MAFQKSNSEVVLWIKRIISWSIFLIPIVYISKITLYPFISFKTLILYALVEIVFFLWLYALLVKKEVSLRLNIVSGSFLLFILALVFSTIFSVDPSLSFWSTFERMNGSLTWLHLGALFIVMSSVFEDRKDWMHLFWINSIVATIIAFISILGKDGLELIAISDRGGSLMGNNSFTGAYLLMSFFLLAILWIREYKNRGLLTMMGILVFFGPDLFGSRIWSGQEGLLDAIKNPLIFLGQARAASIMLFAGFGTLVLGGIFKASKKVSTKLISKILLFVVALSMFSVVAMFFIPNSPVNNFISREASKSRIGAWEISVEAFKTKPLFGYGIGAFSYIYQDFYRPEFLTPEYGAESWMDQAHSVGYELLGTTGLVGIVSFSLLYITSLIFLWGLYKKEEIDFWEALIPSVLIFAHLIQNLTVFDTVSTFQLFVVAFAFIASQSGKEIKVKADFWKEGVGQSLVVIGFLTSFIFFVYIPFVSSHKTISFSKGEFISSQEKTDTLFKQIQRSKIGETEKTKLLSELWRNQISQFPQIISRFPENVLYTQTSLIGELEESLISHPNDIRVHTTLSRMFIFTSSFDNKENKDNHLTKAEYHARKAIELSPRHQIGYWELASVLFAKGDKTGAYESAKQAYDLEPKAMNATEILSQYK